VVHLIVLLLRHPLLNGSPVLCGGFLLKRLCFVYFQLKKLQEKLKKCQSDVESTQEKYNACLTDLNGYNSKYIEDMTEVGTH